MRPGSPARVGRRETVLGRVRRTRTRSLRARYDRLVLRAALLLGDHAAGQLVHLARAARAAVTAAVRGQTQTFLEAHAWRRRKADILDRLAIDDDGCFR